MQQQVNALVRLSYCADARESLGETVQRIEDDIARLFDADECVGIECTGSDLLQVREEADIYSDGRPDVYEAARAVLDAWESGDLAAAVRRLDHAINGDIDDRYNCCPGGQEPDWSQYDAIEVHPICTETLPDGSTSTSLLDDEDDPTVTGWCVYGHLRDEGGLDDITDVNTRARADELAAMFSARVQRAAR